MTSSSSPRSPTAATAPSSSPPSRTRRSTPGRGPAPRPAAGRGPGRRRPGSPALLVGAGRGFIAGADIREFGQPPQLVRRGAPHRGLQQAGGRCHPWPGAGRRARSRWPRTTAWRWPMPSWACRGATGLIPGSGGTQRAPRAPDGPAPRHRPDAERPPPGRAEAWRPACSIASATARARRRPGWPTEELAPARRAHRDRGLGDIKAPARPQDIKADTASKTAACSRR